MENTSVGCQHTSEDSNQTPKQFVMESQWKDMVSRGTLPEEITTNYYRCSSLSDRAVSA